MVSLDSLQAEMSLSRKIQSLTQLDAFEGTTEREGRKAFIRSTIRNAWLESVVFEVRDGKHILMAHQFTKVYGENL